jgi:lipopolysaccharide transport protein LptA
MSARNVSPLYRVGVMLLCALSPVSFAAQVETQDESFRWTADVLDSNFRSDTLELLGNVRVEQGPMSIEAEQATANAFRSENSRWQFQNDVKVRTADADLASETASAAFQSNQLVQARVEGSPAQFEQRGGTERTVRGRARVIEYDVTGNTVTLKGDVWFSYGKDEFRGDTVIYNIRDERVRVNPDGESPGRVEGIIRPRARADASSSTPAPNDIEAPSSESKGTDGQLADETGA